MLGKRPMSLKPHKENQERVTLMGGNMSWDTYGFLFGEYLLV